MLMGIRNPTGGFHDEGPSREPARARLAALTLVVERWEGVVRRRWRVALSVWLVVMVLAGLILWAAPRHFESSAIFLVRTARQDLVIGPNDRTTAVSRDDVPEGVLNSELQLLRGRGILARVVRELKLDAGYLADGWPAPAASELATRDLERGLYTGVLRKTNLIRASYRSQDPELAALVVRHVADAYLAEHLAIHSSPGTYELFKQQAEDANAELKQAEQELAALGRSANLMSPDTQKQEALGSITRIDAELKTLRAELSDSAARARAADTKLREVPPRVPTTRRTVPNQYTTERVSTALLELRNRRTALLMKFNADDRLVAEIDQEIRDTSAVLAQAAQASMSEESSDINPVWQELRLDQMKAQLAMAGLAAKAAELQKQADDYRARAVALTETSPRYDALLRNVAEARSKYELYLKKEEEARMAEALDRQQISNVVLAQAPVVAHVASTPNVRRGWLVGGLAATILSLCIAALMEYLGDSIWIGRREGQVDRAPVTVNG